MIGYKRKKKKMLITTKRWLEINHLFSDEEKDFLNAAISGQTICPTGAVINESRIGRDLLEKLKRLYNDCRR